MTDPAIHVGHSVQ